jgi:hypothetical protein
MSPLLALAWRAWLVAAAALYAGGFAVGLATGARASRGGRAAARAVGLVTAAVAALGAVLVGGSLAAGAFSAAGALGPVLFGVLPLAMTGLGLESWARRAGTVVCSPARTPAPVDSGVELPVDSRVDGDQRVASPSRN